MLQSVLLRSGSRARSAPRRRAVRSIVSLSLALLLGVTPAIAQEAEPSFTQRSLSAMNESSSVGMLSPGERRPGWQGWFADAWEGSKRIFRDGHSDLLLPVYTYHPPYKYPNRDNENHYPWGAGFARTVIDARDNERLVYLIAFSDSHYDFQPFLGYAWIARWPLGAGLKGGLGYTVFVTARADANYIPFPAVLPLASIGNDYVTVYGSWIPTTDVLFFFARISLPFTERGSASGNGAAAGAPVGAAGRRDGPLPVNLLYGAAARVSTDAYGIDSVASGNAWAPLAGYRRLIADKVAIDVSVARSSHSLDLNGARLGTFDLIPLSVTAQYHFPSYRGFRMYAGAGVAYSRIAQQDLPGYTLSSTSISPVLQAGATFALSDSLFLTGGLAANFVRNQLSQDGTTLGTVKLAPVTFSLGLGYAF